MCLLGSLSVVWHLSQKVDGLREGRLRYRTSGRVECKLTSDGRQFPHDAPARLPLLPVTELDGPLDDGVVVRHLVFSRGPSGEAHVGDAAPAAGLVTWSAHTPPST